MDNRRVGYALLGALALVVLALAGSTLTATVDEPGGETGVGDSEDDPATDLGITPPRFDFLVYLIFGTLVLLVVGATYGLLRQPVETLKGTLQTLFAGLVVVGWVLLALYLMEEGVPAEAPPQRNPVNNSTGGNGTGTGEGEATGSGTDQAIERVTESPELLLFAGLAVLTLGVIVAAVFRSGAGEADDSLGAGDAEEDALAAIARVAGEAADRLEGAASVENEVFRAWKRMTELLDVDDPDVRTPGEFRRAAVRAGMAPRDVDELTQLFEAVRYGDRQVTAERERRAIDALRNIEETYVDGATDEQTESGADDGGERP